MRRRGLSLLEVVIGSTLVALIVLFLMNLFPTSIATVRQAENRYQASLLARSILEQWSSKPFAQLTPGPVLSGLYAQTVEGVTLTPQMDIQTVPGTDPVYLMDLHVRVEWTDQGVRRRLEQDLWVHNLP